MKKNILIGAIFVYSLNVFGQAGLIYKPAGDALGKSVLDPNGDGWVSTTSAGYALTNDGPSDSEWPWIPLPTMENEPHSDLTTGANGGHTDIVNNGSGQSVYVLVRTVGGIDYLMVRFRIGKASTASKGYSLLIDTDGNFGTVIGNNPGFEKEVVLETGTRVGVYTHNSGSSIRDHSYDINNYHQRAIAASNTNGDADYFYDYFVPLSALGTSNAVRIVATTITSAQSGISGTVSDFNGIDDKKYGNDRLTLFKAMVNAFPTGVTLQDLKNANFTFPPMKFPPPTVNGGLTASATSISGNSTEADGTVIEVYKNKTPIGKAKVSSNAYTLTGVSGLTQGDTISARTLFNYESTNASTLGTTLTVGSTTGLVAGMPVLFVSGNGAFAAGTTISSVTNSTTAVLSAAPTSALSAATITGTNKSTSDTSNLVVVFAAAQCYTSAPVNLTRTSQGTPPVYTLTGNFANSDGSAIQASSVEIIVYQQLAGVNQFSVVPENSGNTIYVSTQGTWTYPTNLSQNAFNGAHLFATATKSGCESAFSQVSLKNNNTDSTRRPTITTTSILESASVPRTVTILNNHTATANLFLYKNGNPISIGKVDSVLSGQSGNVTYTPSFPGFADGDLLTSRAQSIASGFALSAVSNSVTVTSSSSPTTPPVITGTYLNGGTTVNGTCSEIGGTDIQVYRNGVIIGTTTLSAFGTWTLNSSAHATGQYLSAFATAPGKTKSLVSDSVQVKTSKPRSPSVSNSYMAGDTIISGTATSDGRTIRVYVDDAPVGTATSASNLWTLSGLSANTLYKGARIYATADSLGVESDTSNNKMVKGVDSYSVEVRVGGSLLNEPNINLTSGIDFQVEIRALDLPEYTSAATASSSGTTITVASVTGLDTGMVVKVSAGQGSFLPGTKVVSIDNTTNPPSFVVSKAPITALSSATVTGAKVLSGYTSPVNLSSTKPVLLFTGSGQPFVSGHLGFNGLPNNDTVTAALGGNGTSIPLRVTNPDDPSAYGETTINVLGKCYWKGNSNAPDETNKKGHTKNGNWVNAINNGAGLNSVPRSGADVTFANDAQEDMLLEADYSWGTLDFNTSPAGNPKGKHVILGNHNLFLKNVSDRDTNVFKTTGSGRLMFRVEPGNSVVFHVGNKRYNPLTITNNSLEPDTFKVLVRDEMYANGSNSGALSDLKRVQKTWDISRVNSNSGTGVNLSFSWLSNGTNNGEESQIIANDKFALYHHNGSVWIQEPTACSDASVSGSLRTVTATGYIGTFSPFGLGDETQPLPIELLNFSAHCQAGYPTFEWTTATETNNSHFNLEQSPNLETWYPVAQAMGAGFSSTPKSYSFDLATFSPSKGLYFRLKQTDYDGKHESFDPIHLGTCLGLAPSAINVWPNPTNKTLEITGFDAGSIASVVNALGQQVAVVTMIEGETTYFDASMLPSGMYTLLGYKNGLPFPLKWVRK